MIYFKKPREVEEGDILYLPSKWDGMWLRVEALSDLVETEGEELYTIRISPEKRFHKSDGTGFTRPYNLRKQDLEDYLMVEIPNTRKDDDFYVEDGEGNPV